MSAVKDEAGGDPSSAPAISKMLLHILSPSAEISPQLAFVDIPASTTVGQLKTKIQETVSTKPGPDRQRLIHRGRVLANDADTLLDVFGQQAVNDPTAHSLHLVLRPPTGGSGASTTPQLPSVAQPANPAVTTSTAQAAPDFSVLQTNLPPNIAAIHERLHQGLRHFHAPSATTNPLPAMGHTAGSSSASSPPEQNQSGHQAASQSDHNGNDLPATMQRRVFQDLVGQAQRARAAAGMHGIANNTSQPSPGQESQSQPQPQATPPEGRTFQPPIAGRASTFHREIQGPDGQTWQVTVNENTFTVPGHPGSNAPPAHATGHLTDLSGMAAQAFGGVRFNAPEGSDGPTGVAFGGPNQARSSEGPGESADGTSHQQYLDRIEELRVRVQRIVTDLSAGSTPDTGAIADAYSEIARLEALRSDREQQAGRSPPASANIQPESSSSVPPMASSTPPASSASLSAAPSSVYILSSPTGPYALLVSPSEIYTTERHPVFGSNNHQHHPHHLPLHLPLDRLGVQQANLGINPFPNLPAFPLQRLGQQGNPTPLPRHDNDEAQAPFAPHHDPNAMAQPQPQAEAQPAQPQENQPNDLLRILLPLGGHLWLLIRLLGFIFFFTNGGSWHRTVLVLTCALVIFLAQTPLFAGVQETLWVPIRRHIDGLLPAPVPRADRPAQTGEPTPEMLAAALVRERERRRGTGWLRERIRRVERAVLLLLASLVPGVGERQVAAREAEQAALQRAERVADEEAASARRLARASVDELRRRRNAAIAAQTGAGDEPINAQVELSDSTRGEGEDWLRLAGEDVISDGDADGLSGDTARADREAVAALLAGEDRASGMLQTNEASIAARARRVRFGGEEEIPWGGSSPGSERQVRFGGAEVIPSGSGTAQKAEQVGAATGRQADAGARHRQREDQASGES